MDLRSISRAASYVFALVGAPVIRHVPAPRRFHRAPSPNPSRRRSHRSRRRRYHGLAFQRASGVTSFRLDIPPARSTTLWAMRRLLSIFVALLLAAVPAVGGQTTHVEHDTAAVSASQPASPFDAAAHGSLGIENAAPCCTLAINGCLGSFAFPESTAVPLPTSVPAGRMFGSAYSGQGIDPESDTPPPRG